MSVFCVNCKHAQTARHNDIRCNRCGKRAGWKKEVLARAERRVHDYKRFSKLRMTDELVANLGTAKTLYADSHGAGREMFIWLKWRGTAPTKYAELNGLDWKDFRKVIVSGTTDDTILARQIYDEMIADKIHPAILHPSLEERWESDKEKLTC